MRRALLISPHFPPDSSAATHRVRLLAPYLTRYGWQPTVLTVDAAAYEGALDPDLAAFMPAPVDVVRASAWSARLTRRFGIGDLGLRSFTGLYRAASQLLQQNRFDVLFITIFPAYTALLGPLLSRRFGVPFVLDYQDPWVSAWGTTVGGGASGRVDLKSRVSRALALRLEPYIVRAASAITAVSSGTYEPILERNPRIRPITETIPIGAEPLDFAPRDEPRTVAMPFDPADRFVHICYTGTILPLGMETLRAVLGSVRLVRDRRPDLYRRLRLHFIGTSNQTTTSDDMKVMPLARELGIADVVQELPTRVPYSAAVQIQRHATVLLALGSTEWHYTASKLYPLLLARRPLLAVYHERSTVTDVIGRVAQPPSVRLVTYSDTERAGTRVEAIAEALIALVDQPVWRTVDVDAAGMTDFFAEHLAGRLAGIFDRVSSGRAA